MTAKEILKSLQKTPRQNPIMLAEGLNLKEQTIRNTLSILLEVKLVETPVRGLYEITKLGEQALRKI